MDHMTQPNPGFRPAVSIVCETPREIENSTDDPGGMQQPDSNNREACRITLTRFVIESFSVSIRIGERHKRRNWDWTTRPSLKQIRQFALCGGPVFVLALLLAGCSSPSMRQQRLVAKPNMTFSDSAAFTYNSARLLPQLAPGFASSGASQNSGCTSCR